MLARMEAQKKLGGPQNLCPFGCTRLDINGYCRHLVGWTQDGKRIEVRERTERGRERTGHLLDKVRKTDVLKNSTTGRKNKAMQNCPSPNYRVYRQDGRFPTGTEKGFEVVQPPSEYVTDDFIDDFEPEAALTGAN